MPNVVITSHVTYESGPIKGRHMTLLFKNVRRFGAGEPLLNAAD